MAEVFYNHATELATVSNTFSVDGTPTDPTTITLIVTDPAGVPATYTFALAQITRDSAGAYHKDVSCTSTVAGMWQAVWVGTGTAADVTVVTWETFDTAVNTRYASLDALKSRLGITNADNDLEISLAIETASRGIDEACGRKFWRGTDTRTYEPYSFYELEVDDLVSATTLKTDASGDGTFETTIASTDYQLLPVNPVIHTEQWPYNCIRMIGSATLPVTWWSTTRRDRVQVVGVFGWPAVPRAVQQACLILSAELLKLKEAPFGVANLDQWGPIRVRSNPMAMTMLGPYRKYPILVG